MSAELGINKNKLDSKYGSKQQENVTKEKENIDIKNLQTSTPNNYTSKFTVSTICLLQNLESMSCMNGKSVRIIGQFNEYQQRYPVFVYDTKDIVLIKPSNLKITDAKNKKKSLKEEINELLQLSNKNKRENMAKTFANKLMKSTYNKLNTNLMQDFNKILQGNCIYIPHFFCRPKDFRLLNLLKNDIKLCSQGMVDWSRHLKHENPSFSATFNMIIEYIATYFDMDVFASRLNYYRNGIDWKPYHHDSHAYLKSKNTKEDFTIGVSFGYERVLSFKHVKTQILFDIPQRNGDCFAFNSIVNTKYQHAILKGNANYDERFSIIAWGKRRNLNHKNSGINERENDNTFNGRYIT